MKTISETIKKEPMSLSERGIPETSYFHVQFLDGSEAHESQHNWSDFSEDILVIFAGSQKRVSVSKHPIKRITIHHNGLETFIEPKEGEQVYQAIVSSATLGANSIVTTKIIGRKVGIVKNGIVSEEQMLDERSGSVEGIKL